MAEREHVTDDTEEDTDSPFDDSGSTASWEYELFQDFLRGEIKPYQFDPTVTASESSDAEESGDESDHDVSDDGLPHPLTDRAGNKNWCSCGNCIVRKSDSESICCMEIQNVKHNLEKEGLDLNCVCANLTFIKVCLDSDVLHLSANMVSEIQGTQLPDPLTDREYRMTARRQFLLWIHKKLVEKVERVIPSCVVKAIQEKYPAFIEQDENNELLGIE